MKITQKDQCRSVLLYKLCGRDNTIRLIEKGEKADPQSIFEVNGICFFTKYANQNKSTSNEDTKRWQFTVDEANRKRLNELASENSNLMLALTCIHDSDISDEWEFCLIEYKQLLGLLSEATDFSTIHVSLPASGSPKKLTVSLEGYSEKYSNILIDRNRIDNLRYPFE